MNVQEPPGMYWHVHHDQLMEYCYDPARRRSYIETAKPSREIVIRLRLMQPVKGELPLALVEAEKAHAEAGKALDQAEKALVEAVDALVEAFSALDQAEKAHAEAGKALAEAGKALDQAFSAYAGEIEALHAAECPNCPWDGREREIVFPAAG